jgi:hypothetical protein
MGRAFAILDAQSRSLGEAAATLRGWKGMIEFDLTDGAERVLLTYRLGPPRRGRWWSTRPLVLADATGRPLGTLEASFAGWRGRRFTLVRPEGEHFVISAISRSRETPLLRGATVVGWVRKHGRMQSAYTLRVTGACNHLHAVGLVVFVGIRSGLDATIRVGQG